MIPNILIVEDDKKIAATIKLYLEHEGYRTSLAHDGYTALVSARANRFDLLILDLMLPRIDGLELCRTLRSESDVYVIMLTAHATEEDRLRGLDLGARSASKSRGGGKRLRRHSKSIALAGRPGLCRNRSLRRYLSCEAYRRPGGSIDISRTPHGGR